MPKSVLHVISGAEFRANLVQDRAAKGDGGSVCSVGLWIAGRSLQSRPVGSSITSMGERPARVLAFVVAHPDDDVMGAAGYMALHRHDPELRFVLIHATDGDAGEIAAGINATR